MELRHRSSTPFVAGFLLVTLVLLELPRTTEGGDVRTVFYIDMENHNLTQPPDVTSPQPLMGNPAAPYLNSLMTPGHPNATQTSWSSHYRNVAHGVHPSLPNYLWQEAGTDFGVRSDIPPFSIAGNTAGASQGSAQA